MNIEIYTVSLPELVALAARHKRKITRAWIAKYVGLGLLPPQNKPGLGTGNGRQSHYTQSLADQMVPLIRVLKSRGKYLPAVAWDLWWYGWYVAPHLWRAQLLERARQWDAVRSQLTPTSDDDDGPAQHIRAVGEHLENSRTPWRLIGAVKRHNKGHVVEFLSPLLGVFLGTYTPLSEYGHSVDNFERKETEKLLSTSLNVPIRDDDIPTDGTRLPVSVEALDKKLLEMSGIGQIDVGQFISALPDDEINSARQQLAYILYVIDALEAKSQENAKRSIGGRALLWANRDQKLQAAHLIVWLLLRRDPIFKEQSALLCETLKKQFGVPQRAAHAA